MNIAKNIESLKRISPRDIARASAVAAVGALSLGAASAQPADGKFIARASSLYPAPIAKQPTAPVVEQQVVNAAPVEAAPVIVQQTAPAVRAQKCAAGDIMYCIKMCESGGNYGTNTGNGYYGAYQYDTSTWNGYKGYKNANEAPPEVQDEKAKSDYARRGGSPWPTCSRKYS